MRECQRPFAGGCLAAPAIQCCTCRGGCQSTAPPVLHTGA
jgi:hypothetical protein